MRRSSPPIRPTASGIDIAGAAHLFGGEDRSDRRPRLAPRAPRASRPEPLSPIARCRLGGRPLRQRPGRRAGPDGRGGGGSSPSRPLRLPLTPSTRCDRLGIERIGQLAAMPRAPMTRRFGTDVALRLDQAFGHAFEPISPLVPQETPSRRLGFPEPIGHLDDLKRVVLRLANDLCGDLFRRGLGARRLDLIFRRVDRKDQALRVGTARADARCRAISQSSSTKCSERSIPASGSTRSA